VAYDDALAERVGDRLRDADDVLDRWVEPASGHLSTLPPK
jgi:hypothetical protein